MRILILEKTNILKIRLEKLFRNIGHNETVTFNGISMPFDIFYNEKTEFDVIIFDVDQFPSALEDMMSLINKHALSCKVKVIALTDKSNYSDIAKLYRLGIDDVLLKPFSDEVLSKKLNLNFFMSEHKTRILVKEKIAGELRMLKWCEDYLIGVPEIDNEHKDIIEHYEKLYELMTAGHGHEYFEELVNFLENYVNHHFAHEEELQIQIKYAFYEEHKELHDSFRTQLKVLLSQIDKSNVTNSDLIKINLFIKNWLHDHIMIEDKKIGVAYKKRS